MHYSWARFIFAVCILVHSISFAPVLNAAETSVAPPTKQELRELQGTEWAGIYVLDQKAGYAKITSHLEGNIFTIESLMEMTVKAFGATQKMTVVDRKQFDINKDLLFLQETRFKQGHQQIEVRLIVKDGKAVVTKTVSGETTQIEQESPRVHLSHTLGAALLVKRGLTRPEISFKHQIFEAMPPYTRALEVESRFLGMKIKQVNGVEIESYNWRTTIIEQDTSFDSVMSKSGLMLKTTFMKLMVMRAETEVQAKSMATVPDVLSLSMIRTNKKLGRPSELESLTLKIEFEELPKVLANSRATILSRDENSISIQIQKLELPDHATNTRSSKDQQAMFLKPSPMIQSDHPEVIRESGRALASASTDRGKVQALLSYVHRSVRKTYRAQLSNALDVLKEMEGDCTEHTVLFVALARAAGIPARPVVGLTYTPTSGGGFGGHAWAEVYLAGQWYPVDPTSNQLSADPSHIPLAVGNMEELARISKYIGTMKIEVLDLKRSLTR